MPGAQSQRPCYRPPNKGQPPWASPPPAKDSPRVERGHLNRRGAQRSPPRSPVTRPQHQRHLLLRRRRRRRHQHQRQPWHPAERWGPPRPRSHPSRRCRRHHNLSASTARTHRGRRGSGDRRPPPEVRLELPLVWAQDGSPGSQTIERCGCHSQPLLFAGWLYGSPGAHAPNS